MASRELRVEIIGDSKSLKKALGQAGDASTGFGSKFAKAGKIIGAAALGMGAAVGAGLFVTLKRGFEELAESQKVMAQTAAVIKSTGGAANVSAKQVDDYATSLSQMSGVDDEAIASGENMLLTFKNIRNEAGKGNDIFKQSTATLLDMSVALGTDMNKSAIQLGKALNDPIKGITALTRVGVTFTEGQKETIKSLVESGKSMEAQKIILKELNSEFGGSAEAAGKTLPGQLSKLKNAFDEAAGNLAAKLVPALTSVVELVNKNWPQIEKIANRVMDALVTGAGKAVDAVRRNFEQIKTVLMTAFQGALDIGKRFVAFFQSDFGQTLGIGLAAVLALKTGMGALGISMTNVSKALKTLSTNPFWALMIPLGLLVGELAGNFIKAKIDAAALSDELSRSSDNAKQLKESLDALKQTELSERQAKHNLAEAAAGVRDAQVQVNNAVKQYGPNSAQAQAAVRGLEGSLLNYEQATIDSETATKNHTKAEQARTNELKKGVTEILRLSDAGQKATGTFAASGTLDKFSTSLKTLATNSTRVAVEMQKTDPVASRAAAKTVFLAGVTEDLAKKLGRVPKQTEIIAEAKARNFPKFYAELLNIAKRLADAKATALAGGDAIGAALGTGMLQGIIRSKVAAVTAAASMVLESLSAMHSAADASEVSGETKKVGAALSRGLLIGYLEGTRQLPEKLSEPLRKAIDAMVAVVNASKARTSTAFQQLAGDAMTAFDAATTAGLDKIQKNLDAKIKQIGDRLAAALKKIDLGQAVLTPAEAALQKLDRSEAVRGMVTSLQDAQQALAAAQSGVGFEAKEDETPEQAAERVRQQGEAILAAQEQLRTAQLSIQRDALQQQAERERAAADARAEAARVKAEKAAAAETLRAQKQAGNQSLQYQAQRDLQQRHLQKMLDNLEEKLLQGDVKWSQAHKRIMLAFKDEFGPDLATAGKNLGTAFAKGLKESIGGVGSAAADLAKQIAKYLKLGSPTELGPMSDLDIWWSTLGSTLASGVDYESVTSVGQRIGKTLADSFATDSGAFSGLWDKLIGGGFAGSEAAAGVNEGNTALGDFTETTDGLYQSVSLLGRQMPVAFEAIATALEKQIPRALVPLQAFWSALVHIIEAFQGIVHWAGEAQESIDSMGGGGGGGGGGGTHPQRDVPWLAGGGIVMKPMTAVLGEAGPEAVIPLSRTNSMAGVNINLTVHGSVTSERDLVTSIRNALVQEGRRSGGNLLGGYA